MEGYQLTEKSPESMDCHNNEDLHSWVEVSWSKHTHEIQISESNDDSLNEERAHVTEVEELSLQVHDEILGLAVVPHIGVHIGHSLITCDWFKTNQFTEDEENDSGNNPIEEEHTLK